MSEAKQPTGPSRKNNPRPFQRTQAPKEKSQRPATTRATTIASQSISLTHQDPVERLKQFCEQGKYVFHWNWDRFASGIVCELEIGYQLDRSKSSDRRKVLTKEARYIPNVSEDQSENLLYAQRVLAAITLDKLGLGVPPEENIEIQSDFQNEDQNEQVEGTDVDKSVPTDVEKMMKDFAVAAITKLGGEFDMDAVLNQLAETTQAGAQSSTPLRWADIVKDGLGGV